MPPRKAVKPTRMSSRRGDVAAATETTSTVSTSKHLNLAVFPHVLSLILSYASEPTLFTLLRCSKALHRSAAPLLYRTLYLRPHQLTAMLESGWAPSKGGKTWSKLGSSFSPILRACLQHVRTLHLLEYHPSNPCPNIPRGVFSNNESIVLYSAPGWGIRHIILPTYFHSFGASKLFIRVSEHEMTRCSHPLGPAVVFLVDRLPRSFTSITLIVPLACRLSEAPQLDFMRKRKAHTCDITVALLPWRQGENEAEHGFQQSMLERWGNRLQPRLFEEPDFKLTFVGAEYAGPLADKNQLLGAPDGIRWPWSFTSVRDWLSALEPGTIFGEHEHAKLKVADLRLLQRLTMEDLVRIERNLDKQCADGADPSSPNMIVIREQIAQARQLFAVVDAEWEKIAEQMKDGR